MKIITYKRKKYEIRKSRYRDNNSLALLMYHNNELYTVMTKNLISSFLCDDDCQYIDTNNNPELPDLLKKTKLGVPLGFKERSGFCEYPLYKFDLTDVEEDEE